MNPAFEIGAAALRAGQQALEIYANNVANVNTPGFKRTEARFSEVLARQVQPTDSGQAASASASMAGAGGGVRIMPQDTLFLQGELRTTGNPLDLAIEGQGLIELLGPGGSPLYWRGGALRINDDGLLATSNGYALRALVRNEGADAIDLGIAADTMEATTNAIRRARDSGADILVTAGGASVGDHDLVKRALEAEGVEMAFWRIAVRPGKPMMHGRLGAMRVIGLPGNPVSSYVCAFLFMVPLLRALSGREDIHHRAEQAVLGRDVAANDIRQDYLRARLTPTPNGPPVATPVSHQDSSLLGNLAAADALVIRPPLAPAASMGEPCTILRLPQP